MDNYKPQGNVVLLRYYHTLKHLRGKQIFYRLYYWLWHKIKIYPKYPLSSPPTQKLALKKFSYTSVKNFKLFTFLNQTKEFCGKINWNFSEYGKLWAYNLNYFDFLHQQNITLDQGTNLILQFVDDIHSNKIGLEPFPLSLRCVNWIKFLSKHQLCHSKINLALWWQYKILEQNIEYHILGNHLLENAVAFLFGAYHFANNDLFQKAKRLLFQELREQILADGGHFELSPMYHQIMLLRVLDCLNLLKSNSLFNCKSLEQILEQKAKIMLGWLEQMTFANGEIPLLNDSAQSIAPKTLQLLQYAKNLNICSYKIPLNESGYRKIANKNYEIIVDIGGICANYIPSHTHSDVFNFVLNVNNHPFIVDTGISTYENNSQRAYQRSTKAHNTVQIENIEQSEVWASFRVAKRAKILKKKESLKQLVAIHDGYQKKGALHRRKFTFGDVSIKIIDEIIANKNYLCCAFLHFAPAIIPRIKGNIVFADAIKISFENILELSLENYDYACEFSKIISAKHIIVTFQKHCSMEIKIP